MRGRFQEILIKFVMFTLTSGIGTLVDLGIHWLLSSYVFRDNYWGSFWIAPFISFECAVLVNFMIAYHFVWRERISVRSTRSFWRHYAAYNATATGVFMVKMGIMQGIHFLFRSLNFLVDASYEPVLCNLLALCFSGLINFFRSERVIFKKVKK